MGSEKHWKIKINKSSRNEEERVEAIDLLDDVKEMDYEKMFVKKGKEG